MPKPKTEYTILSTPDLERRIDVVRQRLWALEKIVAQRETAGRYLVKYGVEHPTLKEFLVCINLEDSLSLLVKAVDEHDAEEQVDKLWITWTDDTVEMLDHAIFSVEEVAEKEQEAVA